MTVDHVVAVDTIHLANRSRSVKAINQATLPTAITAAGFGHV